MLKLLVPVLATSMLLLTGCEKTETQTARDVGQARQDAAENVAEAQRDANQAADSANIRVSDAQADYNRIDAIASKKLSKAESDAAREADKSAATARRDTALVAADFRG
jgi:cell division protein FtsL